MVALTVAWGLATMAQGGLYTFSSTGSQAIPDADPVGIANAISFTGTGLHVTDVSFTFNISGGWNGDLYAYLTHGSDNLVLLNRVGIGNGSGALYDFGYAGSGFNNITLRDGEYGNIHNYGGTVLNVSPTAGGTYKPDGQALDPASDPSLFSATGGSLTFGSQFGGANPEGTWTLFFADLSSGGNATLDSWSLAITAVPEPVNVALGIFGGVFLVSLVASSRRVRNWVHRRRDAVVHWIDAV